VAAYNLDGGKSASMVYDGEYVNVPAQGGRDISDIIYLGE
jgi:exopolysaccharide biosynthesis protein